MVAAGRGGGVARRRGPPDSPALPIPAPAPTHRARERRRTTQAGAVRCAGCMPMAQGYRRRRRERVDLIPAGRTGHPGCTVDIMIIVRYGKVWSDKGLRRSEGQLAIYNCVTRCQSPEAGKVRPVRAGSWASRAGLVEYNQLVVFNQFYRAKCTIEVYPVRPRRPRFPPHSRAHTPVPPGSPRQPRDQPGSPEGRPATLSGCSVPPALGND